MQRYLTCSNVFKTKTTKISNFIIHIEIPIERKLHDIDLPFDRYNSRHILFHYPAKC